MSAAPRRRPLHRDDLGVEVLMKRGVDDAPAIELGITQLREELSDLGWPARTPDDDRRPGGRIGIRCRDCDTDIEGAAGKDAHRADTGHQNYAYELAAATIDPSCIDYADPTGTLSMRLDSLADDYERFQDHRRSVQASMRAMATIAGKYMPTSSGDVEVACSVLTCDSTVERTASGGYRGMERINGLWAAKVGVRPTCGSCRIKRARAG